MIDESTLTDSEKQLIADFRAQMGGASDQAAVAAVMGGETTEDAEPLSVTVVNESLGQTPRGEKIQFRGGKPGWKPEPAARGATRMLGRIKRSDEARAEAKLRAQKGRNSTLQLVAGYKEKLANMNVMQAVAFITDLSEHDRERAILAEELGQARVTVLKSVGAVSDSVRTQFEEEKQMLDAVLKND